MGRSSLAALFVVALAGFARAQPIPLPPMPVPPVMPMPPEVVPRPPIFRPRFRPRVYVPPPGPLYVSPYVRPVNLTYARKARILRGIGIPLLSVGVPMAVAGGIVWIVGAACSDCSRTVTNTGIGLLAAGAGLFIPGAILVGVGNYDDWMSRVLARAGFGLAVARNGGIAALRFRF